jgi:hypothetical protein
MPPTAVACGLDSWQLPNRPCLQKWHWPQAMLNGTSTWSPDLQVLDRRADLLDDAGEFVAEGHADARVGHHAVVEVQVRAADAGAGDAHDRVARMLDLGHRLFFDADPVGPR